MSHAASLHVADAGISRKTKSGVGAFVTDALQNLLNPSFGFCWFGFLESVSIASCSLTRHLPEAS
jgi:hypothetical protein